jgi:hypothetical protein
LKLPNPEVTNSIELSIVMPCLNETERLAGCIEKAQVGIERSGVCGEILVTDIGSQDAVTMRWAIPGATLTSLGFQTILSSFFVSILGMKCRP